jgi:lysine 2,3-aminomutase
MEIVGRLRGRVSGLSLPQLVIDIPGGLGKVPMFPSPVLHQDEESVRLQGFRGNSALYPKT